MGYKIVYDNSTNKWAIYSTTVMDFLDKDLSTPESVAEYILEDNSYYFSKDGKEVYKSSYKSRQEIIDQFNRSITNAKDI